MEISSNESAAPKFDDIEDDNLNFSRNENINLNNYELIEKMKNLNLNEKETKKVILKPRDYQQKIFNRAKSQNSIIYVETGKGKTFISIMLMANHLGIDINNPSSLNRQAIDHNKKIIFFVCDTALIEQQKNAISSILGIEVGTIQGKKNKKKKYDYEFFKKMWDSLNVFVAIPSIIYKLLSCGFLKIFDISMLIFDECHHTGDDHPYNKIMEEFYFFYKKKSKPNANLKYPMIYGLTASPLKKALKDPIEASIIKSMENLCENLDSVIIIDPEMNNSNAKMMKQGDTIEQYLKDDSYIEVKSHVDMKEYKQVFINIYNKCFMELICIAFNSIKKEYPLYCDGKFIEKYDEYVKIKFKSNNLEEYNFITEKYIDFYNLRKLSSIFLIFEKIQRQIFIILENLCLNSLILYFDNLIGIYNKLYLQKLNEENNHSNTFSNNNIKNNEDNLLNLLDDNDENDTVNENEKDLSYLKSSIILEIKNAFIDTNKILKQYIVKEGKNYISDRLQKLYLKINDLFNKNDKSKYIIFIANRIVAHFLHQELNNYLKNNFINKQCKEIIGINKRKSNGGTTLTPTLTLKQMNEIIEQFNNDKFNILIGTSAIEEGLDIQSCNAVLALVELRTPKSFIQIKGRARKSNSDFIIFTNSAKEGKLRIQKFLKIGQKMNKLFKDDIVKDFRRENFIFNKKDFQYIFDKRSHSKLTMGNITIFFNEIIQQIKNKIKFEVTTKIEEVKSTIKSSEFEYNAKVSLTTDLNYVKDKFPKDLGNYNSRDNALKMCYFYVLDTLKKFKYLDQHLKFCIKNN